MHWTRISRDWTRIHMALPMPGGEWVENGDCVVPPGSASGCQPFLLPLPEWREYCTLSSRTWTCKLRDNKSHMVREGLRFMCKQSAPVPGSPPLSCREQRGCRRKLETEHHEAVAWSPMRFLTSWQWPSAPAVSERFQRDIFQLLLNQSASSSHSSCPLHFQSLLAGLCPPKDAGEQCPHQGCDAQGPRGLLPGRAGRENPLQRLLPLDPGITPPRISQELLSALGLRAGWLCTVLRTSLCQH